MIHKSILLVDDDDDDQLIFKDALYEIEKNIQCHIASNGQEALNHLNKLTFPPSLIFLDLNMPLMNGFECLERIKGHPHHKKIPVIIFTTSDSPQDQDRTRQMGAESFFTKTADFRTLKAKLQEILKTDFINTAS